MRIRVHANICEWDKVMWSPVRWGIHLLDLNSLHCAWELLRLHSKKTSQKRPEFTDSSKNKVGKVSPGSHRHNREHSVLCSGVGREMDTDDLLLLYIVKSLFLSNRKWVGFFFNSALSSTTLHVWRTKRHSLQIQMDLYRLSALYCPSNCPESDPNNALLHCHAIIVPLWSPSTRVRTIMAFTD